MALTNDLEFQALGWHAEDIEVDEREPLKYIIKIFGKTKAGDSVATTVKNFTPYFYVKVPDNWDKPQKVLFFEKVRDMLPKKLRTSLLPIKSIKKKNFWGFTNKKLFTFIRFACYNLKSMRALVRIFEKPIHIPKLNNKPTTYQLFESNIDPYIRFMHIAEIQPCGWISLPADKYYKTTDILPTISKYDVEVDWQHVKGLTIDQTAPFKVASFDIECTSSSGEFPVAQKNYRTVASQLYELFKWHQTNGSNDYKTKEAIEAAILYSLQIKDDKPNGNAPIFRHNTKEPVSKSLPDEIKVNIDDISTILSGKFKGSNHTAEETKASSRDKIISTLTTRLNKILPPLEGDPIIQIGTTVHHYGETQCSYKSIITLGTCAPIENAIVIQCQTERELLLKWKDLIAEINPDIITGYNIFGFDFSYMVERARELGIYSSFMNLSRICDRECEYKEARLSSSALGDNILKYINMEGRVLIDLMKVVQRDHKLDSYKLDNVAYHFINMNKNDVSPNEIFELQKGDAEDRKTIAEYCIQDCSLCNLLMMKLEIVANNMGMANVCCVPLTFIFMRGQGIKIFSLVLQQCKDEGFMIPVIKVQNNVDDEDEDSYEGAIVLEPKTGIYIDDPISVLDYASLYPSSMISENLSHDMLVLDPQYDNLPGVEYLDVSYDLYDNDKKKIGEKVCRFVQPPNEEKGVIPNILMKLLKARKTTRKRMTLQDAKVKVTGAEIQGYLNESVFQDLEGNKYNADELDNIKDTYTEFQKAVLDGLQNAYKVTANSLYGQIGARTSQIYLKDIAACTTATGRKMIMLARDYILKNYDAEVIYGDTDSLFVKFAVKDENGNYITGKQAVPRSRELGIEVSDKIKKILKKPHDLEWEKLFWPFILLSKKRYVGNMYEMDDNKFKQKSMGIVLKRRDNANIVKKIYGGIIDTILNKQDIQGSITFLKDQLQMMIDGKCDINDLIITKALRAEYKDPTRIAHKVLAERIGDRDPGNKPQINDRIPYVYVKVDKKDAKDKVLQGERIEPPEYVKKHNLTIDYGHYITNQIMKPILQVYGLVVEQVPGFSKPPRYYDIIEENLVKAMNEDEKKVKEKLMAIKENDVKELMFDPYLSIIENGKKIRKSRVADKYYTSKEK